MNKLEQKFGASLDAQTDDTTKIGMHTIENAIFTKYHFSLIECSKNTHKLDAISRKVFGPSQILLERTVLENVLGLASSTDMDKDWMIIQDKFLVSSILNTCKDKDNGRILAISSDKPHIIAEIVALSGVSENKAYKKINEMMVYFIFSPVLKKILWDQAKRRRALLQNKPSWYHFLQCENLLVSRHFP